MPLVKPILNIVRIGDLDAGNASHSRQIHKQSVSPGNTAELENFLHSVLQFSIMTSMFQIILQVNIWLAQISCCKLIDRRKLSRSMKSFLLINRKKIGTTENFTKSDH